MIDKGGQEDGYGYESLWETGDRCLFIFYLGVRAGNGNTLKKRRRQNQKIINEKQTAS